jgi:hypothetical protein
VVHDPTGMIAFLVRTSVKCLLLSALLYTVFFVKMGQFTLFEHGKRIAATPEGQALQHGVSEAAQDAKASALRQLGNPGVPPPSQ